MGLLFGIAVAAVGEVEEFRGCLYAERAGGGGYDKVYTMVEVLAARIQRVVGRSLELS